MTPINGLSPQGKETLISRLQRIANYSHWSARISDVDRWLTNNIGLTPDDCHVVIELLDTLGVSNGSLGQAELGQLLTMLMNGSNPHEKG